MEWDGIQKGIYQALKIWDLELFEHIEVPLIISPCNMKLSNDGIHDGMSICATLIKDFKLKSHSSFRGKTIFESGKKACIVESVGRGNCDLPTRDIYFTVTSKTHKIMFVFRKK